MSRYTPPPSKALSHLLPLNGQECRTSSCLRRGVALQGGVAATLAGVALHCATKWSILATNNSGKSTIWTNACQNWNYQRTLSAIGPYDFRWKFIWTNHWSIPFLGKFVWTNGLEHFSKVSPYTGIGPRMVLPSNCWSLSSWGTDNWVLTHDQVPIAKNICEENRSKKSGGELWAHTVERPPSLKTNRIVRRTDHPFNIDRQ